MSSTFGVVLNLDKDYGLNQACCSLPFFSAACNCGVPAPSCGCAGQSNCGCAPEPVREPEVEPLPVTHKHAYKKRPQFKEITKDVPYTEMVRKVEMRPVEETFTTTIMTDKVVEKPRVVMHTMQRTRQIPV